MLKYALLGALGHPQRTVRWRPPLKLRTPPRWVQPACDVRRQGVGFRRSRGRLFPRRAQRAGIFGRRRRKFCGSMLTSSVGRRGASLAGLLASCFYDAAHGVEIARSSRRCLLMSRPSFRIIARPSGTSAAHMDDRVTSTVTVLDSRCKSARQVWDVGDARGSWPGQTLTTSSAMLMDC